MEAKIEQAFVRLLGDGKQKRMVRCEEVEREVFGRRGEDGSADGGEEMDLDGKQDDKTEQGDLDSDDDVDEGGGVLLPSGDDSTSAADAISKTTGDKAPLTPQALGLKKAREREMVRQAARRGVAFGFEVDGAGRRRMDCVQGGRVVAASFAKGEWAVRWKE